MMRTNLPALALATGLVGAVSPVRADLREEFRNPPASLRPTPLWHLNGALTTNEIGEQMHRARVESGFGGFAVLPVSKIGTTPATDPAYLSDSYFARYGEILEAAKKEGLKIVFYDDINFPSGSAGGLLASRFPGDLAKRLDKTEEDVTGPVAYSRAAPSGALMGVVAMNRATGERINLTGSVARSTLRWNVPEGTWKVMFFTCVPGNPRLVDYLNPPSVDRFLSLTYDEYYRRFPQHFGTTISMTFFDDISLMYVGGYRMWTPDYNAKFRRRKGFDPVPYYPALWYDIGTQTAAARAALFGFRAELFSDGYIRKVGEWAHKHGVRSSGHVQGPYSLQPVDLGGDAIKAYKHSDIPMMDSIHDYGHGRPGFKITGSAAYNYDKPLVAVEIYGNYPDKSMDAAMLYRSVMELFLAGGNVILPHGTWLDAAQVRIPPEISWRNPRLGPELPQYTTYVARAERLLQGGRHVADIGILYPIDSLTGHYRFEAPENRKYGSFAPPETDYLRLSDLLTGTLRRDFTLLHPEVLDEKCAVDGATLRLNNAVNHEQYKVLVLSGGDVIRWSNLKRIKAFYDAGGKVIATSHLPTRSAEFGHDADVRKTVRAIFGTASSRRNTNARGGAAYFVPEPTAATLEVILDEALPVPDVRFVDRPAVSSGRGMLSCLHKVKECRDIFFFANSSDDPVDTAIELRGKLAPRVWDPHTGEVSPVPFTHEAERGQAVTRLRLRLPAVRSLFLVTGD